MESEADALKYVDQLKKASALSFLRVLERTIKSTGTTTPSTNDDSASSQSSRLALESSDSEVLEATELEPAEAPNDLPPRAALYRKPVTVGDIYIVKKLDSRSQCWGLAKILAIILNVRKGMKKNRCLVRFSDTTTQRKPVELNEIAYHETCETMIPKGSGVVSNCIDPNKRNYHPGTVIETPEAMNNFRYLVFFDKGILSYCSHHELHVICDIYKPRPASRIDAYWLKDLMAHDQFMLKFTAGQNVSVWRKGKWTDGTVAEVDCSTVLIRFDEHETAWYHRGSYRMKRLISADLPPHLKFQVKKRRNLRRMIEIHGRNPNQSPALKWDGPSNAAPAGSFLASKPSSPVSDSSQGSQSTCSSISIDLRPSSTMTKVTPLLKQVPRDLGCHICTANCVTSEEVIRTIDPSYSPLAKPFCIGFERFNKIGDIHYKAPCGLWIKNEEALMEYIQKTNLALSPNNFSFSRNVDPLRVFHLEPDCILSQKDDITDGQEVLPISCVNEVNNEVPEPLKYITKRRLMTPSSLSIIDSNFVSCCSCTDDCKDITKCECIALTLNSYSEILPYEDKPLKNDEVLYKNKKLFKKVRSGIFECNTKCPCSKSCPNRVAQFPIEVRLQLFRTQKYGWGVRAVHDIPKGTFICTYVGVLLNELEANEWGVLRGDEYLMDLDFIKIQESRKPDYEEEALNSEEEPEENQKPAPLDEKRREFAEKLRKRPAGSSTHTLRRKKKKKVSRKPRYPTNSLRYLFPLDQAEYVIDAKTTGNIGRYFNHSCAPNMIVQNVFIDSHDLRFPEVSFFTSQDVQAGSELTWDYNYDVGSVGGKRLYCLCLSSPCRFRLY